MARRRKSYLKKAYESTGASDDTSANIYHSMLESIAWQDLSTKQKELYWCMKDRKYQEKQHPNGDESMFCFNKYLWAEEYRLYADTDGRGFQRDLRALINHGFIRCIESGMTTRTKSIYQYSEKWRLFGTEGFEISADEMNAGLARRLRKEKKSNDVE